MQAAFSAAFRISYLLKTTILRVTSVLGTAQTNSEEDRKGAKITARLEWAEWEAASFFCESLRHHPGAGSVFELAK